MNINSKNYFFVGVTELLVLAILKNEDSYVYDIVKTIQDISENAFPISQNSIYAATYKLERENKISEYSKLVGRKRVRVYYHLEESGLAYFEELLESYYSATKCVGNLIDHLVNLPQKTEEEEVAGEEADTTTEEATE